MGVLSELEPKPVFHFFEEICSIPHGSGNVERISNYLVDFAKQRGLEVYQDELKNVIIIQEATPGYEQEAPVILQGHMDMVAVKKPECIKNMKTDGLDLCVDGDLVYAKDTSLGGDDGIAVAYALAVLDAEDLPHPRLEVVITVDEETGMDGARGIDLSLLKGARLLNIDSEEEGIFTVGCAGGARVDLELQGMLEETEGYSVSLHVHGLQGGHSGVEIHKERGNSNQIMGRILEKLTAHLPVQLMDMQGGLADNAIPRETKAVLLLKNEVAVGEGDRASASGQRVNCAGILQKLEKEIKEELTTRDPDFALSFQISEELQKAVAMTVEDTRRAALMLCGLPDGVQAMSPDVPGLVETSLNLGILKSESDMKEIKIQAGFSVRSSVESEKAALVTKLKAIAELAGAASGVRGVYPGWKYRVDSPLRDSMTALYQEMYGKEPEVVAIHAGLECGLLIGKKPELDCISFGPDMKNIHTTEETLSISSTKRVWEFLIRYLGQKQ